jgi:cell cycle sensor histidine kinase DivJ
MAGLTAGRNIGAGLAASLRTRVRALVHARALACPTAAAQHEAFILHHVVTSGTALCLSPLFLVLGGAPAAGDVLLFLAMLLPLAAVAWVARTGRLGPAQLVCMAAIGLVALTPVLGGRPSGAAALVWLALAPLEAAFSADRRLALWAAVVAGVAILAAPLVAPAAPAAAGLGGAQILAAAALLYATILVAAVARAQRERRRANASELERYRVIADVMGDLVLRHDRAGTVQSVSRNSELLFGLPPAELMGRGFFDRIHVADRPLFLRTVAEADAEPETKIVTLRLRCAIAEGRYGPHEEPSFRWAELRLRRVRASDGPQGSIVATLRDVTTARLHEEAIEAARLVAEEANLSKDHFLANVSHELRTPLNAIIGFAEILNNGDLAPRDPERQREYAGIIQDSAQHLLSVVNTILDMSKIQAGTFDLSPEPFAMAPLIDLCCDMLRLKAQASGVELVRAYPRAIDEIVGDKRAWKQILLNLLSNAIKFTPAPGRVTIDAHPEGGQILIQVFDTGIGINARDLARVGDPFFQARATYDRPYEGTGLGLSVVRGLVGLHGGTILIESEPGKGTSVKVRLPQDCRVVAGRPLAARIETISRRSRLDEAPIFPHDMMVKKIA